MITFCHGKLYIFFLFNAIFKCLEYWLHMESAQNLIKKGKKKNGEGQGRKEGKETERDFF